MDVLAVSSLNLIVRSMTIVALLKAGAIGVARTISVVIASRSLWDLVVSIFQRGCGANISGRTTRRKAAVV